MPVEIDFDATAIRVGIAADRLRENLRTYQVMSKIFPALETAGKEVGLYGGTALNKIYFGIRQRLSYDLDIFCASISGVRAVLESLGSTRAAVRGPRKSARGRLMLDGIAIDMWQAKMPEKPVKLQAIDLLHYLGFLVPPMVVPSFSLEYLLANKTITMADRNELKDIYDTWMGLKLLKDRGKYRRYLRSISRERGIRNYEYYLSYQIDQVMLKSSDYYKKKRIETAQPASTRTMLMDIKAGLELP